MIRQRLGQFAMLAFTLGLGAMAMVQMFVRVSPTGLPQRYLLMLGGIVGLAVMAWVVMCFTAEHANQMIYLCVLLLSIIGITEITRIDFQSTQWGKASHAGYNQMMWLILALITLTVALVAIRDYRFFRKFSYISMVIGIILLFSPMIPGLGISAGGARIWIHIGSHSLQPAEFAKIFMAFFFASYLFDHRDQLAVGGKRIGKMHLPRFKDLAPIVIVWATCMGVLVIQRDLGTGLLFFAMFVCMLYVATGRASWIIIGFVFFVIAAVIAMRMFSHVGNRVTAWLHPFDSRVYEAQGGSHQIVTGIFGLSIGGVMGTGLGKGYPALTPLANSDFIFSSLGEELGIVGVFAIFAIYICIISAGLVTAIKVKDGFGKLLASGLVFTCAFQVFTVVGGITLVIPLTGLTLPYMAAGGSSLIANWIVAVLLLIISNQGNAPEDDTSSDTFEIAALAAIQEKAAQREAKSGEASAVISAAASVDEQYTEVIPLETLSDGNDGEAGFDGEVDGFNVPDANEEPTDTLEDLSVSVRAVSPISEVPPAPPATDNAEVTITSHNSEAVQNTATAETDILPALETAYNEHEEGDRV